MQSEHPLKVESFRQWQDLEQLRPAWDALLESSALSVGIFSTWEFCNSWWSAYGADRELLCLVCSRDDGSAVAIAPLYRERSRTGRTLRLIGDDSDDVDGFDCIVQRGFERAAAHAWLEWLRANPAEWSCLELNSVPSDSPVLAEIRNGCKSSGLVTRESATSNRTILLPSSWEDYLHSLSKKMRYSISHQLRSSSEQYRLVARRCATETDALFWLAELAKWQNSRWSERGITGKFEWQQRRAFYEEFVLALFQRKWLSFWALFADDELVAVELGCRYKNRHVGLHPGFDPAFATLSPGVVLRALILQSLIADGVARYDFGAGDDAYKLRWANELKFFSNFLCARRWTAPANQLLVANTLGQTRNILKKVLPSAAFRTLRSLYRWTTHRFTGV